MVILGFIRSGIPLPFSPMWSGIAAKLLPLSLEKIEVVTPLPRPDIVGCIYTPSKPLYRSVVSSELTPGLASMPLNPGEVYSFWAGASYKEALSQFFSHCKSQAKHPFEFNLRANGGKLTIVGDGIGFEEADLLTKQWRLEHGNIPTSIPTHL